MITPRHNDQHPIGALPDGHKPRSGDVHPPPFCYRMTEAAADIIRPRRP